MQKIIIRIELKCRKCKSKAMSIAAMSPGVLSVKLEGESKDQVVVVGEGIDAVGMAYSLRKKVGHATLDYVDQLKKEEEP